MFSSNVKPGDKMLLHVGRSIPDGVSTSEFSRAGTPAERKYTSLPPGFQKGQIVAMLEVGSTVLVEDAGKRSNSSIERFVVARGDVMGKHLTLIKSVKWLKKGFKTKGNPGIFSVDVPTRLLPEMDDAAKAGASPSPSLVSPKDYSWEGGGGTDVCASALNDDPFDDTQEDKWASFKQRVAKSIETDPSMNNENTGSGRWP